MLVGIKYLAKCEHRDLVLEDKLESTEPKPYSCKGINTNHKI